LTSGAGVQTVVDRVGGSEVSGGAARDGAVGNFTMDACVSSMRASWLCPGRVREDGAERRPQRALAPQARLEPVKKLVTDTMSDTTHTCRFARKMIVPVDYAEPRSPGRGGGRTAESVDPISQSNRRRCRRNLGSRSATNAGEA
jgi:hypothetical protein